MDDYLAINLANWNSRVPHHVAGYGLDAFDDPTHVSDVVRFDLPRLPELAGRDVVHLQCHIGTDTVSLARLGAASVTGLDFSQPALDAAASFAARAGHGDVGWVCSDVYGAVEALGGARFDLVYTGIGALCWLPDVRRWAEVVAALLRPGGQLFIREGHPMLWSLCDPREDGLVVVEFPYFEVEGGTHFEEATTYVEHDGELDSPATIGFNHGIGEVITAVTDAGLRLLSFEEHRSVPWNPLEEAMVEIEGGEYELRHRPERLAATYTLRAERPT